MWAASPLRETGLKSKLVLTLGLGLLGCNGPGSGPSSTPTPTRTAVGEEKKDTHGHEEGAEGEIELKPEQIKMIGVVTEKLATRDFASSSVLPATIVGDPDREIKVSVRVEGLVERLFVRVGDNVSQGQPLATISSTEIARLRAEFHTQATATQLARTNLNRRLELNRVGDLVRRPYEEAEKELAQAQMQIAAAQANVDLNRSKLARFEDLQKDGIASKQQLEEARAVYRESVAKLEQAQLESRVSRTHLGRETRLQKTGLLADNEAFQAQVELKRAEQAERAARNVLAGLGASADSDSGEMVLVSPRPGVITERPKAQGEHVNAGDPLLTVLDPGHVWAWVDLPADLVAKISLNTVVQVRVQGLPDQSFQGRLTFITPEVDPDTKKTRARLELNNGQGLLRPNMFAEVVLPVGRRRKVLSLPQDAVVTVENQSVVYIQEEPGHYQRHPVVVGEKSSGWIEIKSGIEAGETIVTKGALALQAEDLKASMGEGGHQH
ncbi:hypothetical protein ABS71_00820 [bacterium SCN 62-11]|nr:MAG: hypothetical protein ABS71_00820 [bacterium SCN 62-11]